MVAFQIPIYVANAYIYINGYWHAPGTRYIVFYNSANNQFDPVLPVLMEDFMVASTHALAMNSFQQQPYFSGAFQPIDFSQTYNVQPGASQTVTQSSANVQNVTFSALSPAAVPSTSLMVQQPYALPPSIPPLPESSTPPSGTTSVNTPDLERDAPRPDTDDMKSPNPIISSTFDLDDLPGSIERKFQEFEEEFGKNFMESFKEKIIRILTFPQEFPWKVSTCNNYSESSNCQYEKKCQYIHEEMEVRLGQAVEQVRHEILIYSSLQKLKEKFPRELHKFFKVYQVLAEKFRPDVISPFRNAIMELCTRKKRGPWKVKECRNANNDCPYTNKCKFYHNLQEKKLGNKLRKLLKKKRTSLS